VNLVGLHEVSLMAGVSRQAISNWMVRKSDFPQPLASLASGPVWQAETIQAWLANQMPTPNKQKESEIMQQFIVGYEYTMAEIHKVIAGDTMSYLPQSGARIVGGRFKKGEMNPNAPFQILVGDLPQVKRKAELLVSQGGNIPVFLKEGPNRWRYHGLMRVVSYEQDPSIIRKTPGSEVREENVVGVLNLENVD